MSQVRDRKRNPHASQNKVIWNNIGVARLPEPEMKFAADRSQLPVQVKKCNRQQQKWQISAGIHRRCALRLRRQTRRLSDLRLVNRPLRTRSKACVASADPRAGEITSLPRHAIAVPPALRTSERRPVD